MTTIAQQVVWESPPTSDEELWWYLQYAFGVKLPRTQVCPDHVAPFTAFADAYFRRNSISDGLSHIALWHGSRGLSGKSFMLSVLGLAVAINLGSDVNLLGGSLAQSVNIHKHMRDAMEYETAPAWMVKDETSTEIKFHNRAKIRPLTASQRTVRGPHPATLLCDEIDEMELEIFNAALGQPMDQINWRGDRIHPYTVACSTWQHPEGTFSDFKQRADEQNIPIYAWCYKETANPIDGWLTQEAIAEKKATIPVAMWETEFDLGEPSIGNRAFFTDFVDATFCLPFEPVFDEAGVQVAGYTQKKESKDFAEYTFANPVRNGLYVATADWGKEQDYTVIGIWRLDLKKPTLVYYLRVNRQPYPIMVGYFNDAIQRYNVPDTGALHDQTGLGNVINDMLDSRARGFLMTGEKRAVLLSNWVKRVELATWEIPKIPVMYKEHKYARYGDLYSTAKSEFHLPDTVSMAAFAEHLARQYGGVAEAILVRRDGSPTAFARTFERQEHEDDLLSTTKAYTQAPTSDFELLL